MSYAVKLLYDFDIKFTVPAIASSTPNESSAAERVDHERYLNENRRRGQEQSPTPNPEKSIHSTDEQCHATYRIHGNEKTKQGEIYYHYETKDELLVAFLEQVLEDVRHGFEIESGSDPVTDLKRFVNQIFLSIDPDSDEQAVPVGAYIEIRAQAVSNEAYRERITDIDRALKEQFQLILQRGIDQDLVGDIDMNQVSEFLVTTIIGVIKRYATTETVSVERVQAEIEQYLDQRVIA